MGEQNQMLRFREAVTFYKKTSSVIRKFLPLSNCTIPIPFVWSDEVLLAPCLHCINFIFSTTSQTLSLEKADTADPSPDESGDKFQLYFCWPISDREMSWWTLMGGLTRDRNFSIIRWSNALREFMFSVLTITLDSSFKIKEDLALEITPAFSPAKWEVKFMNEKRRSEPTWSVTFARGRTPGSRERWTRL